MSDSFDDPFVYWVDPQIRGIIELNEFKITKKFEKNFKKKTTLLKLTQILKELSNFKKC